MATDLHSTLEGSDPLIGAPFAGRYVIRALVARGSMGRVYEAEQLPLGRTVAVKVLDVSGLGLHGSDSNAEKHEQRFLREASTLAQLNHANTVRVFDFGIAGKDHYIVMEFVAGKTLRALLASKTPTPLDAVRIARQICGSLEEAHDLGVVHRDLKPANILITPGADRRDVVKVVDFGLVKEIDDAMHMTAAGVLVGTPMFMAPEQARGRDLDGRCDIYALGIILYRMVSGRYPFEQGHSTAILMAHLSDAPLPFARAAPALQPLPRLEAVVMRCLAKEPQDRFRDAHELQRALKLVEAELLDEASMVTRWSVVDGRVVVHSGRKGAGRSWWGAIALAGGSAGFLAAFVVAYAAIWWVLSARVVAAPPPPAPVEIVEPVETPERVAEPEPVVAPEPAVAAEPAVAPKPAVAAKPASVAPPTPTPASAVEPVPAPAPGPQTSDLVDPWAD